MLDLQAHALQNRTFAILENGTWAPQAAKAIQAILGEMKNNTLIEPVVSIKSSLKNDQLSLMQQMADNIVATL